MKQYSFLREMDAIYIGRGVWKMDVLMERYEAQDNNDIIWFFAEQIKIHLTLLHPTDIFKNISFDNFPDTLYKILMCLGKKIRIYMKLTGRRHRVNEKASPWAKQGAKKMRAVFIIGRQVGNKYHKFLSIRCSINVRSNTIALT